MGSLVLELQRDALDQSHPVSALLRKALTVATKLDVPHVDTWVTHELKGYPDKAELPRYRLLVGELKGKNPVRGFIPVILEDPDDAALARVAPVHESIAAIESMIAQTSQPMVPRGAEYVGRTLIPVYLLLSRSSLHDIIDQVRSVVLEWALALEKQGVVGEGLSFSAQERAMAQNVQHVASFYGSVTNSVVQQGATHSPATVTIQTSAISSLVEQVERATVDLDADARQQISTSLAHVRAAAQEQKPSSAKMIDSLKTLGEVLKTGKAAADIVEAVGKLIGWLAL